MKTFALKKEATKGWGICLAALLTLFVGAGSAVGETVLPGAYITESTTWTADDSPYIVTSNIYIGARGKEGATLTIEPGVEVRFASNTQVLVGYYNRGVYYGGLIAKGTEGEPVRFTSNSAEPVAGAWGGITFSNYTLDEQAILDHCIVEYGGGNGHGNVKIENSSPKIINSTIRKSSNSGIYSYGNSAPLIGGENAGNQIVENEKDAFQATGGKCRAVIKYNRIADNKGYPFRISSMDQCEIVGNEYENNGAATILLETASLSKDTTWKKFDLPYRIAGSLHIGARGEEGATLTIEPGVEVLFASNTRVLVGYYNRGVYYGGLIAKGTEGEPVRFTSNSAEPVAGAWGGITFSNYTLDEQAILDHCIVEYGGGNGHGSVKIENSSPKIIDSTIRKSSNSGIYSYGNSAPIIGEENAGNQLVENEKDAFQATGGKCRAVIKYNRIADNKGYPFRISSMDQCEIVGNEYENNGAATILLETASLSKDTTWKKFDLPYRIAGSLHIGARGEEGATLTIEPGVEVLFASNTRVLVGYYNRGVYYGGLIAKGTEGEPVRFTSNSAEPVAGAWGGITFSNYTLDEQAILDHCIVEYGGGNGHGSVKIENSSPKIIDSTIRKSSNSGIYSYGNSAPIIGEENAGNQLVENEKDAFQATGGKCRAVIKYNRIADNKGYPFRISSMDQCEIVGNEYENNGAATILLETASLSKDTTWKKFDLPYRIAGSLHIGARGEEGATLTIEPGVEVRFASNTRVLVGYYNRGAYYGGLIAKGIEGAPIRFTSMSLSPGSWRGIQFSNYLIDSKSNIEHCIIEYARKNITITNAKPTLRYNLIRNASENGIYVTGSGSNNLDISCNNFKDNKVGIYSNGVTLSPTGNNFIGNRTAAIQASGGSVTADGNWWNDPNGPGFNGDSYTGNVTVSSWLEEASTCIDSPPTNDAPYAPKAPTPADSAVRIPVEQDGNPLAVPLSWSGGDPNPWDTVTYKVLLAKEGEALTEIATDLTATSYSAGDLEAGVTYQWQVVATDDAGGETAGPIWRFTTLGLPPDLRVKALTLDPASGIIAGQTVTITATMENIGSGPCVDPFTAAFKVDGNVIANRTVQPVLAPNGTTDVSFDWVAKMGDSTLEVVADSAAAVVESDEQNNGKSHNLTDIPDRAPPELVSTTPTTGAFSSSVSAITISLRDLHGVLDHDAIAASFTLSEASSGTVSGSVSVTGDAFRFVPDSAPLADGLYTAALVAQDTSGNSLPVSISFTVDSGAPAAPTVTGGTALDGPIGILPTINRWNQNTLDLTGTREAGTRILVNGRSVVDFGSGDWSTTLSLSEGENSFAVKAVDRAGNESETVSVRIDKDGTAPTISATTPAANAFLSTSPAALTATYAEASGLEAAATICRLKTDTGTPVAGTVSHETGIIRFTPAGALSDGAYLFEIQLEDSFTNKSALRTLRFTVDTRAPVAPIVTPVTSPTYSNSQEISGTREAGSAIRFGSEIVTDFDGTTWSHTVSLSSGTNEFVISAIDRAGNESSPVSVSIFFDDIAPPRVTNLQANGEGDGRTVALDWKSYAPVGHNDIKEFRIYQAAAAFTDVSSMTPVLTLPSSRKTVSIENLATGTTVHFAVVAVDQMENFDPEVVSVSATPSDIQPPAAPADIRANAENTEISLSWVHDGADLDHFLLEFGNEAPVEIAADSRVFIKSGLLSATGYPFTIKAVDAAGNESAPVSGTAATLLGNPAITKVTPFNGMVELEWNGVAQASLLKKYHVYVADAAFTSTHGLAIRTSTTETSVRVAGLENGRTYHFAVAAENVSGSIQPVVVSAEGAPEADVIGPELSNFRLDGTAIAGDLSLGRDGMVALKATDPAGVSRVEFFLDDKLIRTDYSPDPDYTCHLAANQLTDGTHSLKIVAWDTLNNKTEEIRSLEFLLALPTAPVITWPQAGTVIRTPVTVTGTATEGDEIVFYRNGEKLSETATIDSRGIFEADIALEEGENRIAAAARNRTGEGEKSSALVVSLDSRIPAAPERLEATSHEGGEIRISWERHADSRVIGYHLYRSNQPFDSPNGVTRVNSKRITGTRITDLPPEDGTWFYRLAAETDAGHLSPLSSSVEIVSDFTAPKVTGITHDPAGAYDAEAGIFGKGLVTITLTLNEALETRPFFSMVPEGGSAIPVDLQKLTDTTWSGIFSISESTLSGTAWAVFSGRDAVGNRGTEIESGNTIEIDTAGPVVKRLAIQPASPVKNEEETDVAVTLGLSETVKAGTSPTLSAAFSTTTSGIASIELTEVAPEGDDVQTWRGTFEIPEAVGKEAPETLTFAFAAEDTLGNGGTRIEGNNRFQIYQGELPPLARPAGLTLKALPGGEISLSWLPVEGAASYRVYRRAQDATVFENVAEGLTETSHVDLPPSDGIYVYAVTSVRLENGEEAESGKGDGVSIVSDRLAPPAPTSLAVSVASNGIRLDWGASPATEAVTYSIYRADAEIISSVDGLTPLAEKISQLMAVDPNPSLVEHAYVVVAKDATGNLSAPSDTAYHNVGLFPVTALSVVQKDDEKPQVSWNHPGGGIAGYRLLIGEEGEAQQIHDGLLTGKTFTDSAWNDGERRYSIEVEDGNGKKSLARSVRLPQVSISRATGSVLRKRLMNRIGYEVTNHSTRGIEKTRLVVRVNGKSHPTEFVSLEAGETKTLSVVIGGYDTLVESADITDTLEIRPVTGETVDIVRTGTIEIQEAMPGLRIENDPFVRGTTGTFRFTLENPGDADMEIVTAEGGNASSEILAYLLDDDENVLATSRYCQTVGDGLVTLPDRSTVARISSGASFASEDFSIAIPETAPDSLTLKLTLRKLHHRKGKADAVTMAGLSTTRALTLDETPYYAQVKSITPAVSSGEPVQIEGTAIDRKSGDPIPEVPLTLIIERDGFERESTVHSDAEGNFSHTFTPVEGEGGIYRLRVVHPSVTDKPVHGTFTVTRVRICPATIQMTIPYNYVQALGFNVKTADGTAIEDLEAVMLAEDQTNGDIPVGIHFDGGNPLSIGGKATGRLRATLWADNTAGETATLKLRIRTEDRTWQMVTLNAAFTEAKPVLNFVPDHIETGTAREEIVSETVTIANTGLAPMEDVKLELVDAPSWFRLNTQADLGDLAVGESREIPVSFAPDDDVAEGSHSGAIKITSANYPDTKINLFCYVTQSGEGTIRFKASDIYTGTRNAAGEIVQGLSGVRIRLQNEEVPELVYNLPATDALGETEPAEAIPAGSYTFRATAGNHDAKTGRILVRPGVTSLEEIFLSFQLVTVEWSVTETTIQDKYEIVLNATYETDVPAPVVIFEPISVTLPDMQPGDVMNGEFTLTNHGLVRADNLAFTLPTSDTYYQYEFAEELPESLGAKETFVLPYKITCLKSLGQEEETGSGGGCNTYSKRASVGFDSECANGEKQKGSAIAYFSKLSGNCAAGNTGSGGSGGEIPEYIFVPGTGGGGSQSGLKPPSGGGISMDGARCVPFPKYRCRKEKDKCGKEKEVCYRVGSELSLMGGEYYPDGETLKTVVPGGFVTIERNYQDGNWVWSFQPEISFERSSDGTEAFLLREDRYEAEGDRIEGTDETQPSYLVYRGRYGVIEKIIEGWRWSHRGNWELYDESLILVSRGNRTGTVATYEKGAIRDRNGNIAFEIETETDASGVERILALRDRSGALTRYEYSDGRLVKETGPDGKFTEYGYKKIDGYPYLDFIRHKDETTRSIEYGKFGEHVYVRKIRRSDGREYHNDLDYDARTGTYKATLTMPDGTTRTVEYSAKETKIRKVRQNGIPVQSMEYPDDRTEVSLDEYGNPTTREYDQWWNLVSVTYPDGTTTSYEYDHVNDHRLVKRTDRKGLVTAYEYNDRDLRTAEIEAVGTDAERRTEFEYDDDWNVVLIRKVGRGEEADTEITMEFDEFGRMVSRTDAEGNATTYTHDEVGNVLTETDALGNSWTYNYDGSNRRIKMTDPLGNELHLEYDGKGRIARSYGIDNPDVSLAYDIDGRITNMTTVLGSDENAVVHKEYDKVGNLVAETDPEGRVTRYTYDAKDRMISIKEPGGEVTTLEYGDSGAGCESCSGSMDKPTMIFYPTYTKQIVYDASGRVLTEIIGEEITQYVYDDAGNLVSKTDANGNATRFGYDALHRKVRVEDANGGVTALAYDTWDHLVSVTDANGNTTRFEYDRNGRQTRELRPEGGTLAYTYDAAGRLSQKTDAKGQVTDFGYDKAGRLTGIRYFESAIAGEAKKTVTFTYDAAGRITSYADGTTMGHYTYDAAGRKLSETVNYGSFSKSHSYTYKKNNLKQTFAGPDGTTYTYRYDAGNRLVGVSIPGEGEIGFADYKWRRPQTVRYPGGSVNRFVFDEQLRTKSVTLSDPAGKALSSQSYERDAVGNLTKRSDGKYGVTTYAYDPTYQLTGVDAPGDNHDEAYTYDPVGNRLTANGVSGSWTYNNDNALLSYGNTSFTYDANGSMTRKTEGADSTVYVYNLENRLSEVRAGDGASIATYYYDPFGKRLWKDVGGKKIYFHYAQEGMVAEFDAAGNQTIGYGFRPNWPWGTDPLLMKNGKSYVFYKTNTIGTPEELFDRNARVVWGARFSAFGERTVEGEGIVENRLRMPGQYNDVEIGLNYNLHRYFSFDIGRYKSVDPIGYGGGFHWYQYSSNNPVMNVDPSGLHCEIVEGIPYLNTIKPLKEYQKERVIGYYNAALRKVGITILMTRLPIRVPDLSKFDYLVRVSQVQLCEYYIPFEEVCYDECDKEVSRKHLKPGRTLKKEEVIVDEYDIIRSLGSV